MKDGLHKNGGNIVLIGFMGSGKTSVGIRLSYKLRRPFLDTDKTIEQREGRSINDIFATDGEAYFRTLETNLLRELSERLHDQILSVGGGTPLREENCMLLKQIGTVVYLRVRPETVYNRLRGDNSRPLLQGEDPLMKINGLLMERKAIYEAAADIIVDVDDKNMDAVLESIQEKQKRRYHENLSD